jgi:hypothetical protein
MKASLGLSKHIPQEIILEESSSEPNSEVSPRAEVFHLQLRTLFDTLDRGRTGELSKANCACDRIHDETKYALGHIFNKVLCKGQTMNFAEFLHEWQSTTKDFNAADLQRLLCRQRGDNRIFDLRLNEKDTESARWGTNNGG